jgi:homoserine kinase type II
MAQFRVLDPSDVVEILGAFGLPPSAYVGHQSIAAGTINTNLRVETTHGTRFLRVNEGKALDDVGREATIIAHLSSRGVPTPAPFRATSGEPYARWRGEVLSLFPWLPGRTLSRAEVTAEHARQVGRALARLHRVGTSFPDRHPGRYQSDEIERRLERIAAIDPSDPLLADAVAQLRPELAALGGERAPNLPSGIIHGDLFIDNVLFDDQGGALVALLDFEQASWGTLTYDLAVTTLAFGFGRDDFRPEIVAALFDGYGMERSLTDAEREAFGHELRFVACRFTVTRITDVYLKYGRGAAPGKDFRRYLLRLACVRRHLASGDGFLRPSR